MTGHHLINDHRFVVRFLHFAFISLVSFQFSFSSLSWSSSSSFRKSPFRFGSKEEFFFSCVLALFGANSFSQVHCNSVSFTLILFQYGFVVHTLDAFGVLVFVIYICLAFHAVFFFFSFFSHIQNTFAL